MSLGVSAACEYTNSDIPRRRLQLSAGASIEGSWDARGGSSCVALMSNHFLRFRMLTFWGGKKEGAKKEKKEKKERLGNNC